MSTLDSYTSYDRANRLLEVTDGTNTTTYRYDGLGNRISQDVNGLLTRYLLDLQPGLTQVIAATTGAGTDRYVHVPRGIHAMKSNAGQWVWPTQDGLGNVRQELSDTLAVNGVRSYEPFLTPFGIQGSFGMPFAATGEIGDVSGLVYLRNRYLRPALGQFISLDPFEGIRDRAMSLNGYSWVEGNTVNFTDPFGLCSKSNADTDASKEETGICLQRALSLCETYGIELTESEGLEFDNVWTTSRVNNLWQAVQSVSRKLINNGTFFVDTLAGFEIEIRGGSLSSGGCAATPSGTKMSFYNCNPDDPWSVNNFIHEFGHILIHRAGDILGNWESIEQKFSAEIQQLILTDAFVGFQPGSRQNTFRSTLKAYEALTPDDQVKYKTTILTEDVADMFLNWVVGSFANDETNVGIRRSEFVEGLPSKFDDGTQIENIGMKGWAAQAGKASRRSCSAQTQASLQREWLVSLTGDKCIGTVLI